MKNKNKKENKKADRKVLTFFLLAFPTLLIIAMGSFFPDSWLIQILLAFYQFILLKQVLDDYYGHEEMI